jgi:hypothetical protein
MELCRVGGVEFLESLEAACEDELFSFVSWEIAGSFDRNIDPIGSGCHAVQWKAVG